MDVWFIGHGRLRCLQCQNKDIQALAAQTVHQLLRHDLCATDGRWRIQCRDHTDAHGQGATVRWCCVRDSMVLIQIFWTIGVKRLHANSSDMTTADSKASNTLAC